MFPLSHFCRELKSGTVINRPPGCVFSQESLTSELDAIAQDLFGIFPVFPLKDLLCFYDDVYTMFIRAEHSSKNRL